MKYVAGLVLSVLCLSTTLASPTSTVKRYFFFVDTNSSENEVRTARSIAATRGESFVLIPEGKSEYYQLTRKIGETVKKKDDYIHSISRSMPKVSVIEMALNRKKNLAAYEEYMNASRDLSPEVQNKKENEFYLRFPWGLSYPPVSPEVAAKIGGYQAQIEQIQISRNRLGPKPSLEAEFAKRAREIKASGGQIDHLTVSGHDGGGSFGGDYGRFDPQLAGSSLGADADILDGITSLGLLGCYATTIGQANQLKKTFPNMHLMVGYDGSAPLAEIEGGWEYYKTVVLNEAKLENVIDDATARRLVTSMNQALGKVAHPSFWLEAPKCGSVYFYSKDKGGIVLVDSKECEEARAKSGAPLSVISDYYYGKKALPADRSKGELRDAYSFIRKYEQCLGNSEQGIPFPGHSVALLLFWEDTKKNFLQTRGTELDACLAIVRETGREKVLKNLTDAARETRAASVEFAEEKKALLALLGNKEKFLDEARRQSERSNTKFRASLPEGKSVIAPLSSLSRELKGERDYFNHLLRLYPDTPAKKYTPTEVVRYSELYYQAAMDPEPEVAEVLSKLEAVREKTGTLLDRKKLKTVSRADLREGLFQVTGATEALRSAVPDIYNDLGFGCIKDVQFRLESELFDMGCAPFSWHEFDTNSAPEGSLCSGNDFYGLVMESTGGRQNQRVPLSGYLKFSGGEITDVQVPMPMPSKSPRAGNLSDQDRSEYIQLRNMIMKAQD